LNLVAWYDKTVFPSRSDIIKNFIYMHTIVIAETVTGHALIAGLIIWDWLDKCDILKVVFS